MMKINAEMSSNSVCRLCLTVDAHNKMFSLIPVQDLYEKVTNNRLHTVKLPVAACYICYAQLKKCYKFMLKSTMAENTLVDLLQTQTDITPKSVCTINRYDKGLISSLTVTPVRLEIFPVEIKILPLVKTEPVSHEEVEIKVEVSGEDMAVSDEYCEDESEDDNVPLEYIKSEGNGGTGPAKVNETRAKKTDTGTDNKLLKIRPGKSHECTICQMRFTKNSQLIRHLRTHTGEKPYECNICSRKFSQMSHLKIHSSTHTGPAKENKIRPGKSHECTICQKRFAQNRELINHTRRHTGEKPFGCDFCHNTFRQMSTLTRHKRIHTGERPYECHLCDWKFKESSTLKRHLAFIHKNIF